MRQIDISAECASRLDAFTESTKTTATELVERLLEDLPPTPLERVLDALEQVVQYVARVGGYMDPEDQMVMRRARDVLEEHGRRT